MKIRKILIYSLLLLFGCNNASNLNSVKHQIIVDKAHVGMTIREMKALYKGSEFIEEPLFKYGVDSEDNGITVKLNGDSLFFVWTMQGNDTIHSIVIISNKITIDDNVKVGMTLEDFLKKYPKSRISIDELSLDYEYISVPDFEYRVEFLTTKSTMAADYDYSKTEPEFISIKRPMTKIDRIRIIK